MRALTILGLCITAAFVCASAFLVTLGFNLPPADAAYGRPPFAVLTDPFFMSAAMLVSIVVGLVSFPFVYFTVRDLPLRTTAPFLCGIVLLEIVTVTPFSPRLGLGGSAPSLVLALLIARFSRWPMFGRRR
jgi:hypothetical protein